MRISSITKLLVLTFLLPQIASAELIPGSTYNVATWKGGAYSYDDGQLAGTFSHCVISGGYKSGYDLHFSLNRDGQMNLGLSHADPKFVGQTQFPVSITVDRRPAIYAQANVINDGMIILQMPDMGSALHIMKKGRVMTMRSYLGDISFNLGGTFKALDATYECARKNFHFKSVASSKPSVDLGFMYQAVTHMVNDLGLSDFKFMNKDEIAKVLPNLNDGNTVMWNAFSGKLMGGVTLIHAPNLKNLKDSDADDIAYISRLCLGDVLTGAMEVKEAIQPTREIVGVCNHNGTVTNTFLTKFRFGDYSFYTFFAAQDGIKEIEEPKKTSRDLAIKAALFVQK
tara:strand:+ start:117 stop:1139 length:1023 start_codon:yes stop_codon:yes gene_type:complete